MGKQILEFLHQYEQVQAIRATIDADLNHQAFLKRLCLKSYAPPTKALIDPQALRDFLADMIWLTTMGIIQPKLLNPDQTVMLHQFGALFLDVLKYLALNEAAVATDLYLRVMVSLFNSAEDAEIFLDRLVKYNIMKIVEGKYQIISEAEVAQRTTVA
jgi:hypothetical protein